MYNKSVFLQISTHNLHKLIHVHRKVKTALEKCLYTLHTCTYQEWKIDCITFF